KEISLLPASPLQIRVVDPGGVPIPGLDLGITVQTGDSDWAVTSTIEAARARTDADGRANVPWAPREKLRYVDTALIASDWKVNRTDLERIGERIVTVHATLEVPV